MLSPIYSNDGTRFGYVARQNVADFVGPVAEELVDAIRNLPHSL